MNKTALKYLTTLRKRIEQADHLSAQTLTTEPIDNAAKLIQHTDPTLTAEVRERDAIHRLCRALAIDLQGNHRETIAAWAAALQATDTYMTRVRSAPSSALAKALHGE